jgi:hypothetical protein
MSAPEANFWNTLKRHLPKNCYPTRIENRHGGGIPDIHFVWSGLVFWIELKTTKTNTVRLAPNQIAWNTAYSRSGGLSFILVKHLSRVTYFYLRAHRAARLAGMGFGKSRCFGVRGTGISGLRFGSRGSGILKQCYRGFEPGFGI